MDENGKGPTCHAPDCPSRPLIGAEAFDDADAISGKAPDGRGHALVGGQPWHFGCVVRASRALLSGAVLSAPPASDSRDDPVPATWPRLP